MTDSLDLVASTPQAAHRGVQRFRTAFAYDPASGELRWREQPRGGRKAGDIAGCLTGRYFIVGIDGDLLLAHRIIWVMQTGSWPSGDVDHRDGDGYNNRWANLRDVPHQINNQNERKAREGNRSCLLGVSRHRNGRYRATIVFSGKQKHLGYFDSAETAHEAYLAAKRLMHEGCTI